MRTSPELERGPQACFCTLDDQEADRIQRIPLETAAGEPIQPGEKIAALGGPGESDNFAQFEALPGFEMEYIGQIELHQLEAPNWFEKDTTATWERAALFRQPFLDCSGQHAAFVMSGPEARHTLFFINEDGHTRMVETAIVSRKPEAVPART